MTWQWKCSYTLRLCIIISFTKTIRSSILKVILGMCTAKNLFYRVIRKQAFNIKTSRLSALEVHFTRITFQKFSILVEVLKQNKNPSQRRKIYTNHTEKTHISQTHYNFKLVLTYNWERHSLSINLKSWIHNEKPTQNRSNC